MRIILLHGYNGNEHENWFPWLKEKLEEKNQEVIVPSFPTPENQSLSNWLKVVDKYLKDVDEEIILIGHSTGALFILNILERYNSNFKQVHLVAPFKSRMGVKEIDDLNQSFFENGFNYKKIKENCNDINVYYSDNDPYITKTECISVAREVNAKEIEVKGAKHFNEAVGYLEFELLLNNINI